MSTSVTALSFRAHSCQAVKLPHAKLVDIHELLVAFSRVYLVTASRSTHDPSSLAARCFALLGLRVHVCTAVVPISVFSRYCTARRRIVCTFSRIQRCTSDHNARSASQHASQLSPPQRQALPRHETAGRLPPSIECAGLSHLGYLYSS